MHQQVETQRERDIVDKDVENIKEWIQRITFKHKSMGGFEICPFAAGASWRIERKSLSDVAPIEGVDVAIFIVGNVSLIQMLQRCTELNMIHRDYIFLDDHSSDPTYIQGIQSNYGHDNLILVQKRHKLLEARDALRKTEFYQYWSEELYNRIVKG